LRKRPREVLPKGDARIAQRFNVGNAAAKYRQVPKGRLRDDGHFSRPFGTVLLKRIHPMLKGVLPKACGSMQRPVLLY
jgi:hypothetical protein